MSTKRNNSLPFIGGAGAGLLAWLLGYILTYLVVAPDISDSGIQRLVEAFEGSLPTTDVVGWTFFNAHFVDTIFQNVPFAGTSATTFIGGEDGFTVFLYLIPPALLVVAGLALARYHRAGTPKGGILVGLTVLPGYLVLSIAGAFVFTVTGLGATVTPSLVPAIVIAGVIYPVVFAGAGGVLGAVLESRDEDTRLTTGK